VGLKYSRYVLIILAFMLASTLVHAYSIDSVWAEWQGHEVKTLSPTATLPNTVLKLKASSDFADCFNASRLQNKICTISMNAGSLSLSQSTKVALSQLVLSVRDSCAQNLTAYPDGSYICKTSPFTLSTSTPDNIVTTRIKMDTQSKSQSFTLSITQDNSSPTLVSIKTNYCDDTTCYASNSPFKFTVEFSDNMTSFDYNLVYLTAGTNIIGYTSNCTDNVCTGSMTLPCNPTASSQEFQLKLGSVQGVASKEDAQNLAIETDSQQVTCVDTQPLITQTTAPVGDGPANQIVRGGTLTFQTEVRSYVGPALGYVNTSNISDVDTTPANCINDPNTSDSQMYICTWQITDLKVNSIVKNKILQPFILNFVVSDAIGNTNNVTQIVNVLNLTTLAGNKTAKEISGFTGVSTYPTEGLNRMTLNLAASNSMPYPFYVNYNLKGAHSDSKIVNQVLDRCWYKLPDETDYNNSDSYNLLSNVQSESRILYPSASIGSTNRLSLQLRAPEDVLDKADVFNTTCQIEFVAGNSKSIFSKPELENITFLITLRESRLGEPGAVFVDKIQQQEASLRGGGNQFLLKLRTVRASLDGICGIMDTLTAVGATGSSLTVAGQSMQGTPASGIGTAIKNAGVKLSGSMATLTAGIWGDDSKPGVLKQVCRQVNCRGIDDFYGKIDSQTLKNIFDSTATIRNADYNMGVKINEQVSHDQTTTKGVLGDELTSNLDVVDYKNSMVMSMLHLCVGGMVYNAGKWQDINCGYLQCLKDQSLSAGSVSVCDMGRSYKMCTQVVGEVMELPFARIIKNLAANINAIINNLPGFMFKVATTIPCITKGYFTPLGSTTPAAACMAGNEWECVSCHVARSITNIVDLKKTTNQVFVTPMVDDTICLKALCNANDTNCPTSFDRTASIQKYTNFLKLNTYLYNQKARQTPATKPTTNAITTASGTSSAASVASNNAAILALNKQIVAATTASGKLSGSSDIKIRVAGTTDQANFKNTQNYYFVGTVTESSGVESGSTVTKTVNVPITDASVLNLALANKDKSFFLNNPQAIASAYSKYGIVLTNDQDVQIFNQYANKLNTKGQSDMYTYYSGKSGVVKSSKSLDDLRAENVADAQASVDSAKAALDALDKLQPSSAANLDKLDKAKSDAKQALDDATAKLNAANEIVNSAKTAPGATSNSIDQQTFKAVAALDTPDGTSTSEWEQTLKDAQMAGQINNCKGKGCPNNIDGYDASKADDYTKAQATVQAVASTRVGNPAAAILVNNLVTCENDDKCSGDTKKIEEMQKALKDAHITPTADGDNYIIPAAEPSIPQKNVKDDLHMGDNGLYVASDGKQYILDPSSGNFQRVSVVPKQDAADMGKYATAQAYTAELDLALNTAVQALADRGYLDFLSTSYFGDWGKGITATSNKLFNPDQWKQNLCNDMVVNIEDNDQGVVFDPTQGDNMVSASFGAEVTQIENESGIYYMYVYTVYATNPQRPYDDMHHSGDGKYNFKLDMALRSQNASACKKDCVPGDFDMIDGTFKLNEGINFGSGQAPKHGILYSRMQYTKICLNFDKTYPSPTFGKTTYCRTVQEKVYDTGSPFIVTPPAAGTSAGSTVPAGATATGSGAPSDTGALAGELQ
jgi:ElaB/YqjD/DUF883 family membrane-anchored ribosome-binding protein